MGITFRSHRLAAHIKPTLTNFSMKVFATLATILGLTYAAPEARMGSMDMMRSNLGQQQQQLMQPRMDMMAEHQMPPLRMSPMMKNMYSTDQTMSPNQYFLQDKFGNYAYAFANQNSEKMEKGDQNSVKGHYAYIMSNGQKRRVDYIADNQGFHVIRDDADNAGRFKRSVEPDLIQTKMTSYMDSSSLRDNSRNQMMTPNNMMHMNRMGMMDNQMGRNMYRNTMNNGMSSQMVNRNMMTQDMNRNMMNQNMIGQDMSNNMMYSNMMNHNMPNNMMTMNSHDMMSNNMMNMNSRDIMSNNMMNSRDMMSNNMMDSRDMMSNNMMSSRDMMSYNMMNNQMMGQDMMHDNMNRMNPYANNERMGQNRNIMSQRMEIEQIP